MSHESHIAQESQTLMIILNVIHLNVGEVEAGCPEPLLVPGLHLGDAAVVGGRVQEVGGAVRGGRGVRVDRRVRQRSSQASECVPLKRTFSVLKTNQKDHFQYYRYLSKTHVAVIS